MNEKNIIIDPIITHNNYLIEVVPGEFVNVTQLWREYKQLSKDNNILQNRIDDITKILKSNHIIRSKYEALCQYLGIYDYEIDLEEFLKGCDK